MTPEQQRWYAKGYAANARRANRLAHEIEEVRRSASFVLASVIEYSGLTLDQIIDAGVAKIKAEQEHRAIAGVPDSHPPQETTDA